MKKYKAIITITYILMAICGFAADYFYNIMPNVVLTKAQVGRVVDSVSYSGTVQAQEMHVFSSSAACVVNIYVQNGQYVKEGELLASLDINDTSVERIQRETQSGLLIGQTIDEHLLSEILSAAEGDRFFETIRVDSAAVRAPIDGYITGISVREGEYADVLTPIFVITDRSQMHVRIRVPEDRISEIAPGQMVWVTGSGFGGKTYYGYVEHIADRASQSLINNDGAKVMVDVSLNYPGNSIMPGFTATATIRLHTRDSVVKIPLELIDQDDTGKEYVWVFRDGAVYKTYIACRYTAYGYAEVSGFDAEQWIVEEFSQTLQDGVNVQLAEDWKAW